MISHYLRTDKNKELITQNFSGKIVPSIEIVTEIDSGVVSKDTGFDYSLYKRDITLPTTELLSWINANRDDALSKEFYDLLENSLPNMTISRDLARNICIAPQKTTLDNNYSI